MIHHGDCLEVLRTLPDNSVDAIVTDPPYGLSFMGKRWDYDVPSEDVWAECFRVLKPGGHLLAFAGTRTQHRMAVRIEDAGFEIRDMIAWVYSTGFPKSLNLDRAATDHICICDGRAKQKAKRDLRPVREADVSQAVHDGEERGQVLQQGVPEQGAPAGQVQCPAAAEMACQQGMEGRRDDETPEGKLQGRALREGAGMGAADGAQGRIHHGAPTGHGGPHWASAGSGGSRGSLGSQPVEQCAGELGAVPVERGPQARGGWPVCAGCGKPMVPKGLGTALKPALEPITVARKPLQGTVAENVLAWGCGALNIDGCRVDSGGVTGSSAHAGKGAGYEAHNKEGRKYGNGLGGVIAEAHPLGRWPANLIHDGSEEVLAGFPQAPGQQGDLRGHSKNRQSPNGCFGKMAPARDHAARGDTGSAARFFYAAKASKRDRGEGNTHPTVKPTDLMRYLCRLVTPPGGTVLDPFAGSGSTGKACALEGFAFIGIEREAEYVEIARERIAAAAVKGAEKIDPQMGLYDDLKETA